MERIDKSLLKKGVSITALMVLILLHAGSCKKDNSVEPEVLVATSIELVSGANQIAIIESVVPNAIEVLVKDQHGNPFKGTSVNFSIIEGSLSAVSMTTDTKGKATVIWTLGATVGSQTLVITAFKADSTIALTGSSINVNTFANAKPVFAESIVLISGDNQLAEVESLLPNSIEVIVKDQHEEPFEGSLLHFSVAEGILSDSLLLTNAAGRAVVSWTLGQSVGTQSLTITAFNNQDTFSVVGIPLVVNATATAKSPVPTTISIVSGENQSAKSGETLAKPIVVQVKDQYGEPYIGAIVNFSSQDGILSEPQVATDINGKASVNWTLDERVGIKELSINSFKEDGLTELEGAPLTVLASALINFKIGDFYEGGVVFYINEQENFALVVALTHLSSFIRWGCLGIDLPIPEGSEEIARGHVNSLYIEAFCDEPDIAAKLCLNFSSEGYDDWFLPSIGTLELILEASDIINTTAVAHGGEALFKDDFYYWSSTQHNEDEAFAVQSDKKITRVKPKNFTEHVRAVRYFTY